MSMQMLGTVRYAPSRDVVYLLPSTITTITHRVIDRANPQLSKYLDEHGITEEEMVEGLRTYSQLMALAEMAPDLRIGEASDESGWTKVRWEVQVAILYHVGVVMTGSFYAGVREAAGPENAPIPTLAALTDAGEELADYLQMPRWKKWFYQWKRHRPRVGF